MSDAALAGERADSVRMIRESAAAVVPSGGDRTRVRALRFAEPGFDRDVWRRMGDLGWIGLRVPEARGGAGLGMSEACALAEALGGGLAPEPLIPCALSASLLAAAGSGASLEALLAGEEVVLTAWQEGPDTLEVPGAPGAPRRFLPLAAGADAFLVPVREGDALALYRQPRDGADLAVEPTQDGGSFGTLRPAGGERIAEDVGPALAVALDEAALGTAAALLGMGERAFAMTLDYLRTRQQFGRPIGSFQVLQHRMADLRIQIALTRASVEAAAATLDVPDLPPWRRRSVVSRAKARAADATLLMTREAIQLHGGIGYTDEADIGLYLRRAMVLANQFGSAALHRRRFVTETMEEEA